jgi:hypothetical protein
MPMPSRREPNRTNWRRISLCKRAQGRQMQLSGRSPRSRRVPFRFCVQNISKFVKLYCTRNFCLANMNACAIATKSRATPFKARRSMEAERTEQCWLQSTGDVLRAVVPWLLLFSFLSFPSNAPSDALVATCAESPRSRLAAPLTALRERRRMIGQVRDHGATRQRNTSYQKLRCGFLTLPRCPALALSRRSLVESFGSKWMPAGFESAAAADSCTRRRRGEVGVSVGVGESPGVSHRVGKQPSHHCR